MKIFHLQAKWKVIQTFVFSFERENLLNSSNSMRSKNGKKTLN